MNYSKSELRLIKRFEKAWEKGKEVDFLIKEVRRARKKAEKIGMLKEKVNKMVEVNKKHTPPNDYAL